VKFGGIDEGVLEFFGVGQRVFLSLRGFCMEVTGLDVLRL
jgi:hypothetical protein